MITHAAILQDGLMYVGRLNERHHDIIRQIVEVTKKKPATGEQGFIDETGKFYDRLGAGFHALECGQVKVGKANIQHEFNPRLGLFSEDLW